MSIDLRLGDWRDVLADVECDALITDPPYGAKVHSGHKASTNGHLGDGHDASDRKDIPYTKWEPSDVAEFVSLWSDRVRGWMVALTSSDLIPAWVRAYEAMGRYVFQPLPCVIRGMTCRLGGDGPSSWAVYAMVARPRVKPYSTWGTLPGAYVGPSAPPKVIGGKPMWLMNALVRDYSRAGDLVCDPCAGAATTLMAAEGLGREAVGAEVSPGTWKLADSRITEPLQRDMFA